MTTTEDFDAHRQFVARYQGSSLARAVHLVAAIGEDGKARAYCRNYDPGQVFLSADPRAVTCRACLSHAEWLWKTRWSTPVKDMLWGDQLQLARALLWEYERQVPTRLQAS